MIIRTARPSDLEAMGKLPDSAAKAIAAEVDGELVGIGGVYFDHGKPIVFSSFSEILNKKQIFRGAREIMKFVDRFPRPIYAICEDTDKARRTLSYFKFRPLAHNYWVLQ